MPNLAVIPSDSIQTYIDAGRDKNTIISKAAYDPLHIFDEVYLLSPLEKRKCIFNGVHVIPTKPRDLPRRIKTYNIDIVRAYGGYWPCDMACKNKVENVQVLVSVHDKRPALLHDSIKYADFVLCVSETVSDLVRKRKVSDDRIIMLPNKVDLKIFKNIEGDFKSEFDEKYKGKYKILHVGRKAPEKNLDTLIKALKILGGDYIVVFVGFGDKKPYENLANAEGVLGQCFFEGAILKSDLPEFYSWCSCMCVPSRWEGFGIVFIEALACQSVVVTSDIAPMNEYIKQGENGLLVEEYENPQALAETIRVACNDKQLRERLKKNARKSVERFEKNRIDELECNYYEKILSLKLHNNTWRNKIWNSLRLH